MEVRSLDIEVEKRNRNFQGKNSIGIGQLATKAFQLISHTIRGIYFHVRDVDEEREALGRCGGRTVKDGNGNKANG